MKAELDATKTLMRQVQSVYQSVVDRTVLQEEEQEVEEEDFLEYISSDDSDGSDSDEQ